MTHEFTTYFRLPTETAEYYPKRFLVDKRGGCASPAFRAENPDFKQRLHLIDNAVVFR